MMLEAIVAMGPIPLLFLTLWWLHREFNERMAQVERNTRIMQKLARFTPPSHLARHAGTFVKCSFEHNSDLGYFIEAPAPKLEPTFADHWRDCERMADEIVATPENPRRFT